MEHTINDVMIGRCKNGDLLYHYTSVDGIMGIIINKTLWATSYQFLNDYSEIAYSREIVKEFCAGLVKNKESAAKFYDDISKEMSVIFNETFVSEDKFSGVYISSFSLNHDSPLLWAEFNDFKGYIIEIKFEDLAKSFIDGNDFVSHGKVVYDIEEQKDCLKKELDAINKEIGFDLEKTAYIEDDGMREKYAEIIRRFGKSCVVLSMFFKKKCFEQEHEYRIVCTPGLIKEEDGNKMLNKHLKFRTMNNWIVPYYEIVAKKVDKVLIESITVGPLNNRELAKTGLSVFLRANNYDIEIKESNIPIRYK